MVREFDERNMARSRERCAAMAEVANTGKRVLTERERAILDMWPRFEDTGDPVMVGDAYIDGSGDCNIIVAVRICDVCVDLVGEDGFLTGFKPGERVKRPAPEVLDADGVEIKVGDTVWDDDGVEMTVMSLVGELPGHVTTHSKNPPATYSINPKRLTHTHPDSWERLEEDAESIRQTIARNFGDFSPSDFKQSGDSLQDRVSDIVRRAKALAGVEQ